MTMISTQKHQPAPPRSVFIRHEPEKHAFFVVYFERAKHTRHMAAQFDDSQSTLASVTAWVRANPRLRLVCAISGVSLEE